MTEKTLIIPDYYDHFHCKGGACRNSCCIGWGISVSMNEYFRLIGLDCSEPLHARLECAFHQPDSPSPERYALISPDWRGDCPMHGADGLCTLHKECGEDMLPSICRMYPRCIRSDGGESIHCVCSASCEAVTELLLSRKTPLIFRITQTKDTPAPTVVSRHGQSSISRLCLSLIQDSTHSLPQRLERIGGAMTRLEQSSCAEADDTLSNTAPASMDAALRAVVRMLHRLSESSPSLRRFGETMLRRYSPEDEALPSLYRQDCACFEQRFPDWMIGFENLLANHMLYEDFPFTDDRLSPTGEYTALAGIYAAMRVMSVGSLAEGGGPNELTDALAGLFRCIEHAAFYLNADYLLECEERSHPTLLHGVIQL